MLVWYPYARLDPVDEEGWCLLVDCFASPLVGVSASRLLLSRRLDLTRVSFETAPPLEARMLEPVACDEGVLSELRVPAPAQAWEVRGARFEPADYIAVRTLGSRMALRRLEDYFRSFIDPSRQLEALVEAVKPERLKYAGIAFALLGFDRRGRIYLFTGREKTRARLLEMYLARKEVKERLDQILGKSHLP